MRLGLACGPTSEDRREALNENKLSTECRTSISTEPDRAIGTTKLYHVISLHLNALSMVPRYSSVGEAILHHSMHINHVA